ncbi:MAG: L-serine ammonia-lyase [Armatimonadetes bacterium]|nr:L-serine ammonia-lyase [Armatimonadota bacterium]MBX3109194.1 L-serine ammonia-lyase [Fimbriimonadaceae bacterium]
MPRLRPFPQGYRPGPYTRPVAVLREAVSVFDIFKIGVGPSSSHTLGPWRAAQEFVGSLPDGQIESIHVDLFGSLAKTGKGHGTDIAVQLGLMGWDPRTCDVSAIGSMLETIQETKRLMCRNAEIEFAPSKHIVLHRQTTLPFHPNGLTFSAIVDGAKYSETYYSVGGGFVVKEHQELSGARCLILPYPVESAAELSEHCRSNGLDIPAVSRENEARWRPAGETESGLADIWSAMKDCIYRGCHTDGVLPGGLNVVRRAKKQNADLVGTRTYSDFDGWVAAMRYASPNFQQTLRWISVFALAVNEENAAFGRVVTAPTNGAAGVIPAVMMYGYTFLGFTDSQLHDFLLVAGEIGCLFKKGATISAAMGGCMAEIGVSSAMAAAGHAYMLGCDTERVLMAAEIAMEHHLGLTCDPVGGLVQVPCIERNTMGAMKAITAANIALASDPALAKVSLDDVIATMWETAKDMNTRYKETSEGGLAVRIPVVVPEC